MQTIIAMQVKAATCEHAWHADFRDTIVSAK